MTSSLERATRALACSGLQVPFMDESQPFRVYCSEVLLEGAMASRKRTFAVGLSAPTGLYFPKDETLKIVNFPSEVGRINLEFQTYRVEFDGFDSPVRVGLWID